MSKTNSNKKEEDKENISQETKDESPVTAAPSQKDASEEKISVSQDVPTTHISEEEKFAELNDKYLRLYADFENFRKRVSKEKIDLFKFAGEDILTQLIPVMDDFERAMKAAAQTTDIETIQQGEQLIYNKIKHILTQNGVQEMKSAGEKFDPEFHDAVTNIPAPSEDMKGKVVEEVEKGYFLNGKVLRHAKVIVGN